GFVQLEPEWDADPCFALSAQDALVGGGRPSGAVGSDRDGQKIARGLDCFETGLQARRDGERVAAAPDCVGASVAAGGDGRETPGAEAPTQSGAAATRS